MSPWHGAHPDDNPFRCHINDNKDDNRPGNLKWGSKAENSVGQSRTDKNLGHDRLETRIERSADGRLVGALYVNGCPIDLPDLPRLSKNSGRNRTHPTLEKELLFKHRLFKRGIRTRQEFANKMPEKTMRILEPWRCCADEDFPWIPDGFTLANDDEDSVTSIKGVQFYNRVAVYPGML